MNIPLTWAFRPHRRWLRLKRALTLGTRIIVLRGDEVLLVRMTYTNGWFLPGGGVNHGETFEAGAQRELEEECGIQALKPEFHGVFVNQKGRHVDHIGVFIARDFTGEPRVQDPLEIAEVRFFFLRDLPKDLLPGQRRRIEEALARTSLPRLTKW